MTRTGFVVVTGNAPKLLSHDIKSGWMPVSVIVKGTGLPQALSIVSTSPGISAVFVIA